jgi:hypothetical protein
MLSYLRFPALVSVWMVALMSGILSLYRELYGLYVGTLPPRSVFWSSFYFAFVISAAVLWGLEHKAYRAEYTRNKKPELDGRILCAFWDSLTDHNGHPCLNQTRLVVNVRLVNKRDVPTTISSYALTVIANGAQYDGTYQDLAVGTSIMHHSQYSDRFTTEGVDGKATAAFPLTLQIKENSPLRYAIEQGGWLEFRIPAWGHGETWNGDLALTVVDALRGVHVITGNLDVHVGRFS